MKAEYVNPFIEAVYETCRTKLNIDLTHGNPSVHKGLENSRDIAAIIGLSGPATGTVMLSFPVETALAMVSQMVRKKIKVVDEVVKDGVSELVNKVAVSAKAKFAEETGKTIELGLPTIVRGNGFILEVPTTAVWLDVPFESLLGNFFLRVSFSMHAFNEDER
jgi:CheY-specific phosphatase CheX